jgi:hypothetical protein
LQGLQIPTAPANAFEILRSEPAGSAWRSTPEAKPVSRGVFRAALARLVPPGLIPRNKATLDAVRVVPARIGPEHDRCAGVEESPSNDDFIARANGFITRARRRGTPGEYHAHEKNKEPHRRA